MFIFLYHVVVPVVLLASVTTASSSTLDVAATTETTATYTIYDDLTWAVVSPNLTHGDNQRLYDDYMRKCRLATAKPDYDDERNAERAHRLCDEGEEQRLHMNQYQPRSMLNYTKTGFQKIRAPDKVFRIIEEFWKENRDRSVIEWNDPNPYHNIWDSPPTILRVDNTSLPGGGPQLQAAIAEAARDALEAWTGSPVTSTSVYGIRIYHNGSILSPHVDRLPLVSSCIINVAQDVDEPWFLEVYGHDGIAHNVTMEPGDLVLYESHSVIHGRPFPLKGKFFANIFVHFEPSQAPIDSPIQNDDEESDLPPYLIPGSVWESEWREMFPEGRQPDSNENPFKFIELGDISSLRKLAKKKPSLMTKHDGTAAEWAPIHEACRQGKLEVVKFLIEERNVDVNQPCKVTVSKTPLAVANFYLGAENEVSKYLVSLGGKAKLNENTDEL